MKLIIVILLKENERLKVKKELSRFTRKLANEDFLEKLLRLKTETDFSYDVVLFSFTLKSLLTDSP